MKQSNRASFLEAFSKTKGHYVGGKKNAKQGEKGRKNRENSPPLPKKARWVFPIRICLSEE